MAINEYFCTDSSELLNILNEQDDLPQWVDQDIAIAKSNISKVLDYIRSEKTQTEKFAIQDRSDIIKFAKGKMGLLVFGNTMI